jgi:hypothetical protein
MLTLESHSRASELQTTGSVPSGGLSNLQRQEGPTYIPLSGRDHRLSCVLYPLIDDVVRRRPIRVRDAIVGTASQDLPPGATTADGFSGLGTPPTSGTVLASP